MLYNDGLLKVMYPPFYRYLQIHFIEWKSYLDHISLLFVNMILNHKKSIRVVHFTIYFKIASRAVP